MPTGSKETVSAAAAAEALRRPVSEGQAFVRFPIDNATASLPLSKIVLNSTQRMMTDEALLSMVSHAAWPRSSTQYLNRCLVVDAS
jgi:hypothetical protein